jgi:hypothetical protein
MGRQWNAIIDALSGGTMSINANLTDIEALLTTLQADVADGIFVTSVDAVRDGDGNTFGIDRNFPISGSIDSVGTISSGTINVSSGTVTPKVSTTGGTGPTAFTSTSYGTIATANTGRLGCQVFNEGTGNLYITLGTATTSTSSYTVRLLANDYYEVPSNYTGLIGGIFSTAGTARVTQLS